MIDIFITSRVCRNDMELYRQDTIRRRLRPLVKKEGVLWEYI